MMITDCNVGRILCKEAVHKGEMAEWTGVVIGRSSKARTAKVQWLTPARKLEWIPFAQLYEEVEDYEEKLKFSLGDRVRETVSGEAGRIVNADNLTAPEYQVSWDSDDLEDSWEDELDLEAWTPARKKGKSGRRKCVKHVEESTMTQEFMDELQTVDLGETIGVLVHSFHIHEIMVHIAGYLEQEYENRRVGGE